MEKLYVEVFLHICQLLFSKDFMPMMEVVLVLCMYIEGFQTPLYGIYILKLSPPTGIGGSLNNI